ncbi:Csu type fimbrial protein [Halomonas elongata]|uniref:Csu type fimbrial protein n=1 Tax=Halomonas elongata TaxID=2746 RepID=UPI0011BE1BBB|nr:spore coat U domain-containing protein [Halomonas elongata]
MINQDLNMAPSVKVGYKLFMMGVGLLLNSSSYGVTMPTQTFQVTAAIIAGCEVSVGSESGNYGTIDFGSASTLATGDYTAQLVRNQSVFFYCTNGVTLSASFDGGGSYSNGTRNMLSQDGSNSLIPYALYSDASMTTPITVNGQVMVESDGQNQITIPVYGKAHLSGNHPAGRYSDTLTLTVTW